MRNTIFNFLAICLLIVGIMACDVTGEQNYDFKQANSLAIEGGPGNDTLLVPHYNSEMVEVPVTISYNSKAFTINKEYDWTVSPSVENNVRRQGEFLDVVVTSDDANSYTISVDDGEYQGERNLVVVDTTAN